MSSGICCGMMGAAECAEGTVRGRGIMKEKTKTVIAALLLGVYAGNLVMITSAAVLGVGHIGIHRQHQRELAS